MIDELLYSVLRTCSYRFGIVQPGPADYQRDQRLLHGRGFQQNGCRAEQHEKEKQMVG